VRILVCGGRDFNDYRFLSSILDKLCKDRGYHNEYMPEGVKIIAGKAKGADTLAIDWAVTNWLPFQEFPADWEKHGKAAGYIRNQQMLNEGKPDLVVAFPGGKGTAMMVSLAKKAGIEVIEVGTS